MPQITTMVGVVEVEDTNVRVATCLSYDSATIVYLVVSLFACLSLRLCQWGDEKRMCRTVKTELAPSSNIRVCIRVRPPNQRELALDGGVIVRFV